jgi:hypothetical protein
MAEHPHTGTNLQESPLVTDAIAELQAAVVELHELQRLLDVAEAVP